MTELKVLSARQDTLEASEESLREWVRGVDADAHTALDVARQNVKLMTALRATQLEQGHAIAGLATELGGLKDDVALLKGEVSLLKGDVSLLKGDVSLLKGDVSLLKGDVAEIKDGLAEVLRRLPA